MTVVNELDATPEATGNSTRWKAEQKGDMIAGIVREVKPVVTKFGTTIVITVAAAKVVMAGEKAPSDTYAVWAGQAYLERQIQWLHPVPGDEIAIRYDGEGQKKAGQNAPKLFTAVIVDAKGVRNPPRTAMGGTGVVSDAKSDGKKPDDDNIPF
jgi:hypothetical protein